jgi:hypothetical protein
MRFPAYRYLIPLFDAHLAAAGLANALWLPQQLWQLGDVRRNTVRPIPSVGCDRKATLFEYLFAIEIKAIAATK